MGAYARELRKQLEASIQPKLAKANPLRTLGFSSELLKLGLSEDELYEHAYATARILMKRMHPDSAGSHEVADHQRRVSEAFDLLKSRELFSKWLRDLREEIEEEHSEMVVLRNSTKELQRAGAASRKTAAEAAETIVTLRKRSEGLSERFQAHLLMRAHSLKGGNVFSAEQNLSLRVMRFVFYSEADCTKRRVTMSRRRGEILLPVAGLSKRDISRAPGAPDPSALDTGFGSLRHLLSKHTTRPVVGISFHHIVSRWGHYAETAHHPKGERVILGSVLPSDLDALRIGIDVSTRISYENLPLILSNEIYVGVLLVSDDVQERSLRGGDTGSQLDRLRGKIRKRREANAFVNDIVVAVRSSDRP